MRRSERGFSNGEFLVVIVVLALISTFLLPALISQSKKTVHRRPCESKLKSIGISLLLYSGDYRFFPHMTDAKKENTPKQVGRVFETLIYFKLLDNPQVLICPQSDDRPKKHADSVINKPREINLSASTNSYLGYDPDFLPIQRGDSEHLIDNPHISYTYLRGQLNQSSADSYQHLCSDKDFRKAGTFGNTSSNKTRPSIGNHDDGFNVLHVDGHASFLPLNDNTANVKRLVKRLVFDRTNAEADFGEGQN